MTHNLVESKIQQAVVRFLQVQENLGRLTYFSVPNNPRSAATGLKLKREGMRAGTPDLCILAKDRVPLFVEMKAPKGSLTQDQILAADRLSEHGAIVTVCHSLTDVEMLVGNWLQTSTRMAA
jgi:hypothetical protein